jgi:hypothetical protein
LAGEDFAGEFGDGGPEVHVAAPEGEVEATGLTPEQTATLDAVMLAHDPTKQLPPQPDTTNTVLYEHENRLRALEGAPPLTIKDFAGKINAP